ncbi:alpha/beta hydrolase fold domain containing protein [Neospora caninum Liverpool]|uniref:Alpha/beta hydrolase fold domain containing protein n=1 Tax=Neospora caninum (strain Liverpool) TaxID=572307 RepID=F0VDH2_NEOCL|nr:alpha/beta hydrolase fold domain containing protein [Neospora caninum Liverpool]CBZ51765.1 alpha/beta hydrolase fold domain containing protein [Neospora caninum Liverpool]|eukprot:XP_003881798.1 alpha/beta hydrolase fold domain containing protein [Neospora caninum Liverpool]
MRSLSTGRSEADGRKRVEFLGFICGSLFHRGALLGFAWFFSCAFQILQFFADPELSFHENLWGFVHFVDDFVTMPCYYAFSTEAMDAVRRRANRVMSVALMKEIQPVAFKHTWRLRPRDVDASFFSPASSSDSVFSSIVHSLPVPGSSGGSAGIPASIYEHPEALLPPSDPESFVFPARGKGRDRRANADRGERNVMEEILSFAGNIREKLSFSGDTANQGDSASAGFAPADGDRGVQAPRGEKGKGKEIEVSHTSASRQYWRLLPPLPSHENSRHEEAGEFAGGFPLGLGVRNGNRAEDSAGATFTTINITAYFPSAPPHASEDERQRNLEEAFSLLRLFASPHSRLHGEAGDLSASTPEGSLPSSATAEANGKGKWPGDGGGGREDERQGGGKTVASSEDGREGEDALPKANQGGGKATEDALGREPARASEQVSKQHTRQKTWREKLKLVFGGGKTGGGADDWPDELFEKHTEFVSPDLLNWREERGESETARRKDTTAGRPALFFFHGGGLVMSDHRGYDKLLRRLSNLLYPSGALVFAIDYRLAPEHKFPLPLQDCLQAISFVVDQAKMFGVDGSRLAILGDSGGGSLAAAVMGEALRRVDAFPWVKNVRSLTLVYPSLCRGCATRSQIVDGSLFYLKRDIWFSLLYSPAIGAPDDWRQKPFTMPPALLRQFPPTFLVLFTHDIMYDIGVLFHEKLRRHGVRTGIYIAPGFHGFFGSDRWSRFGVPSVEWTADRIMKSW